MSLENINLNPRLTQWLVHQHSTFADEPLIVLDVGARGGSEPHWKAYGEQLLQIGFEPDRNECDRLNQTVDNQTQRFYPVALGRCSEKRTFYHCSGSWGSSFYPANFEFLTRFPDEHAEQMQILETVELETIDLDSFVLANQIPNIDFIKLDVEGCELDCLRGSVQSLEKSVLGLSLEVLFHSSLRNQPTFSEIDLFLNSLGFRLFDLASYRHARKALPFPPNKLGTTRRSQLLWGQALYLRDGIKEILSSHRMTYWIQTTVLKLVSLMEVFCLQDCAVKLLQTADQKGILSINLNPLINRLIPIVRKGLSTRSITCQEYLRYFEISA